MKIDIIPVAGKIHVSRLNNVTAVVVDVLRATTNMVLAVKNGAAKVIPTYDAAEAASFVSRLGARDSLLAGETGGLKTPGFDLGNSPFEFGPEAVKGRTIIMSTTNGTGAVCAVANAEVILIGAMINATAVAKAAHARGADVLIVCAGTDGMISADDLLCAGAIAEELAHLSRGELLQTDIVMICRWLYRDYLGGGLDLESTFHYSRLLQLDFAEDAAFCMQRDLTDVVPVYNNGIITKA